jgi:hypothetical protein
LLYSSYLPLGVPNGLVIHHAQGQSAPTSITRQQLIFWRHQQGINNRIKALNKDDKTEGGLDKVIVKGLGLMLDTHNSLVKKYRMAKEVLKENKHADMSIRLLAPGKSDGPQFNLPSTDELAALVFGELTLESPCRDIIIRNRISGLQRISSLHPAYMALQYPLLFPYAERGFQLGVNLMGVDASDTKKEAKNDHARFLFAFVPTISQASITPTCPVVYCLIRL